MHMKDSALLFALLLALVTFAASAWLDGAFADPVIDDAPEWHPSAAQQREIERVYTEADLAR